MDWRNPAVFGPEYWGVYHKTAATYPTNFTVNDIMVYGQFFYMYGYILPCLQCSQEYSKLMEHYGVLLYQLLAKKRIYVWVLSVIVHDEVNIRLHKSFVHPVDLAHLYGFSASETQTVFDELVASGKLSRNLQQQLTAPAGQRAPEPVRTQTQAQSQPQAQPHAQADVRQLQQEKERQEKERERERERVKQLQQEKERQLQQEKERQLQHTKFLQQQQARVPQPQPSTMRQTSGYRLADSPSKTSVRKSVRLSEMPRTDSRLAPQPQLTQSRRSSRTSIRRFLDAD